VEVKVGDITVKTVLNDITEVRVEAIVNAANSLMVMGGGVAGAIKRKAGEEVEREAIRKAPVPVGEAIATGAGRLKAKYVIHAPTMPRPAMATDLEAVRKATRAALRLANQLKVESVAFPALGAGVGGLRVRDVARVMGDEVKNAINQGLKLKKILFVARSEEALREMEAALRDSLKP